MARMNKSKSITGRPKPQRENDHAEAVQQAVADGLGEYAPKLPDGTPALFSSAQRRAAERARDIASARRGDRDSSRITEQRAAARRALSDSAG